MSDKYPGGFVTANAPAGSSVYFNGSSYITAPSSAAFNVEGGAYTIETFVYFNTVATAQRIFVMTGSSQTYGFIVGTGSTSNLEINLFGTGATLTATNAFANSLKAWSHVCVVSNGTNRSIFVNGVRYATTTSALFQASNNAISIAGVSGTYAGGNPDAYFSNFRVVKGTALYDPTQTTLAVPTQLLNIANTQLLTLQNQTIVDNSVNAFTLTSTGTPVVSNFTPFAAYTGFNPALGAAAGGVWTLDEAAYYQNNRQWPIYDPYFNNTTLMLHGNGTNAAQNNTFLDSSTNNFTITRNGNTTQGTFTPFSQTGWSYNGTAGAYCQLNNADYAIGTGDFTIEFWMYCVDDSTYGSSAFAGLPGAGTLTVSMSGGSSNARQPYLEFGGTSTAFGTLYGYLNKWTHIAYVRRSGFVTVYQNGVATSAPVSRTQSFPNCANLYLARLPTDTAQDFRGYMSNYRITKAAVYSSNFTPSTTPLVPVSNTVLLTFQDNRFVDNSALRATVTPAGTASVQAFSPFVPAYITPTTYSNYFDGTGDYLTAPNAAWMDLGTGSFTMECWVQFNTVGSTQMIVSSNYNAGTGGGGWAFLYRQDNTTLKFSCNANVSYEKTWSPAAGTMYHVAVCRSGTDLRLFVNGVQIGTTSTSSDNISGSSLLFVGSNVSNPLPINGVISNLRIVTSALYTANFTPPTAPLTAVTNTQLLTCQSSTFVDNSVNAATLTANGNVQPVTSPTPFPAKVDTITLNSAYSTSLIGGSAYFDGSGDYLTAANNAAFNLPADFTIECWWYPMDLSGSSNLFCIGDSRASYNGLLLYWSTGAGKLILYSNGANVVVSSLSTPINTWYHLAAVRSGSTVTFYINGASVGTATNTTTFTGLAGNGFAVGAEYYGTFDSSRKMYLTGSRLVKGTAVYTSNFAPPITPPTAVTNTQLLLNYTNGAIFDNTAKNVCETVGTAQISTTQSKWGGSSIKTDGSTSSWVLVPFNRNLDISTGAPDWTIELWGYVVSFANSPYFFNKGGVAASTYTNYGIEMTTGGVVSLALGNNGGQTSYSFGTCVINTWYHFAATRQGNTIRTFLNGTLVTNTTLGTTMTDNGEALYIGCLKNLTSQVLNGYVDDLRITKGVARYVTNFTPPTSQLQDQ